MTRFFDSCPIATRGECRASTVYAMEGRREARSITDAKDGFQNCLQPRRKWKVTRVASGGEEQLKMAVAATDQASGTATKQPAGVGTFQLAPTAGALLISQDSGDPERKSREKKCKVTSHRETPARVVDGEQTARGACACAIQRMRAIGHRPDVSPTAGGSASGGSTKRYDGTSPPPTSMPTVLRMPGRFLERRPNEV